MTIHVCGTEQYTPMDVECPFCQDIVGGAGREVFDGYGFDRICGFCGTHICDGEYNPNQSQASRRRMIAFVDGITSCRSSLGWGVERDD